MKKHLKKLIVFAFLIVCTLIFAPSAFALGESTTLTVTTVIDNAADYPTQVAALSSQYSAERIYSMQYKSSTAYAPTYTSTKTFNIVNNKSTTISYGSYTGSNCNTFWFTSNQYTDKHLSLYAVEYTSANNLKAYTYSPNGSYPNANAIQPFNWVEVIDSRKPSSVTLHFRYNPDIGSVTPDPDPNPGYAKTIDYLGDGVANPDTTVNGVNDYRLYLDLQTEQAAENNKADIIFVLDVSGSMKDSLSSGQSKISVMKSTMTTAINNLTTNPDNRISIIKFSSQSQVLVSNSTNKTALLNAVSNLAADGGTNYYDSMLDAIKEVNKMTANNPENRDKVVIFLTDGEPTFAYSVAPTTTNNAYAGMVYACHAARQFSNVDKFYSVFIGDNTGSASTLQTITQMVSVSEERYMVQAASAQQLTDTLNRFMSKMSNSLYNVTITDGLSDYVSYNGGMTVTQKAGSNPPVTLTLGVDYSVSSGTDGSPTVTFKKTLASENVYTVSFNVRPSGTALDYFDEHHSYPDLGDTGTDYTGNATSSGCAGFYSNAAATLKYSFGTNGSAEKAYNKPVVQAVLPTPATTKEITLYKVLSGKDLTAGMFSFEVFEVKTEGTIKLGEVTNAADGTIKFDTLASISLSKPGTYTYLVKEVIPEEAVDGKFEGMTYDTKTLTVKVTVSRAGDTLVTAVEYPDQQNFNNTYKLDPVYVTLKAMKVFEGKDLVGDDFGFDLLDSSNGPVGFAKNDLAGNIIFNQLEFTKEGVYNYTIREVMGTADYVQYDTVPINVTITVTDNKHGALVADVVYSKDTFINKYHYSLIPATIEVKKVLTGMQLVDGLFEFKITGEGVSETVSNVGDTISFNPTITAPGTYTYTIQEITPPEDAEGLPYKRDYMTYDKHKITVTVTYTDDGSGTFTPTVKYSEENPTFYNSYQIRGSIW
jgi:pilin isopeptide linkage protein